MAVRVDLRPRVLSADERVVRGRGPVVAQAQNLANVAAQILRLHSPARIVGGVARVAIADREVEEPVGPDFEPARGRTGAPRVGDEDLLDARERFAVEAAARERDRRVAPGARLHVGEVQQPVTRKVGVQHDRIHAARLEPLGGPARDRCRIELAAAHDPEVARQLGHEHVGAAR